MLEGSKEAMQKRFQIKYSKQETSLWPDDCAEQLFFVPVLKFDGGARRLAAALDLTRELRGNRFTLSVQ